MDPVESFPAQIAKFLLDNIDQGFLLRDAQYRIILANDRFAQIAAIDVGDLGGHDAREIITSLVNSELTYESEIVSAAGQSRIVSVTTSPMTAVDGAIFFMDLVSEIRTDRALRDRLVAEVQKMSRLAQTDPLTGQTNRAEFDRVLGSLTKFGVGDPFGLAILDLDEFKEINDRFGHATGDAVLVEFARRLRRAVRDTDLVARIGGDEFAVLCVGAPRLIAEEIMGRLADKLSFSMQIGSENIDVHASVGWAHSDDAGDQIFNTADQRMYADKRRKKGI